MDRASVGFTEAYRRLAEQGKCDSPGGAEYERVLHEWVQVGRPSPIETFIVARANVGPGGVGRERLN